MIGTLEIVKSKKAMKILEFLLTKPNKEFYQAELLKNTNVSKTTAIKWLSLLNKKDFVKLETKGKSKFYRLNSDNPIIKQLKVLVTVTDLYEVFSELKNEPIEVYLYGSAARGEDTEKSDIDILILGKIENKKIIELVEKAKNKMKVEIKPFILNPIEYSNLIRKDRIFYENVEKNRIRLL